MSSFELEITNETNFVVDEVRLLKTAAFAMNSLRLNPVTELSIALVSLAEMERLHIEHMDEPGATDVLSFEMDEIRIPAPGELAEPGILGDVILSPEFVKKQAAENGNEFEKELDMLLVHGILHLLGHDHAEPEDHKVMFGMQEEILKALSTSSNELEA